MQDAELRILVYYPKRGEEYRSLLLKEDPTLSLYICETTQDIMTHIGEADILFTSIEFPLSLLGHGKQLKWIQTISAGIDSFVHKTSFPKHILLTRVNVSFGDRIAEYVMAYLLSLSQRTGAVSANQTQRRWKAPEPGVSLLRSKVLGILGVGAVGGSVADKAKCFGMRVLGLDMLPKQHPSLEKVYNLDDLDKFLGEVDFLVICLPLTSRTEGLLGTDQFAAMRKDAFLINVARGVIVKQSELIRALQDNVIGGAVLDVFEEEPLPSSSPLWHMRNVIVTPHIAGGASPGEMVDFFAANLRKYRRGETLQGIVDLELGF